MRITPANYLQVFVNSKLSLEDVLICRLDGCSVLLQGHAAKGGRSRLTTTLRGDQQHEVLQRIVNILARRGMQRNMVEFTDGHGDVYSFQLAGGLLKLSVNGTILDHDLTEVHVDGYDGRMIQCKGVKHPAAIVMTVPSGMQELAVCILALFRQRVALQQGEQTALTIYCACAGERFALPKDSTASRNVSFGEDGLWPEPKTAVTSSQSLASTTRCSAVSSGASSCPSSEASAEISASLPSQSLDATTRTTRRPRRTPVRHWLLRPPVGSSCPEEQ